MHNLRRLQVKLIYIFHWASENMRQSKRINDGSRKDKKIICGCFVIVEKLKIAIIITLMNIPKLMLSTTLKYSRFFFAKSSRSYQKVHKLQEVDYSILRKKAIDGYNTLIHQQKTQYNKQYKNYEDYLANVKTQQEYEQLQKEFQRFVDLYYNKIEAFSQNLKKQLDKIQLEEKTDIVKSYLLDNLPEEEVAKPEAPTKKGFYIPNRLVLKKLYHGTRDKAKELHPSRQILLAGIESQEQHSLFLSKIIDEMNIKNIVTMVSPDLPYFIKTERSYIQEWTKFIENNDYAKKCKFYLNPLPKTLEDVCLHDNHIPLVRQGLSKSRTFLENYYCLMKENQLTKVFEPAPLFTGLLSQNIKRIYFGNYPAFQERRMIADHTSLNKLRELFQLHLRNFKLGKFNFSAQWLFPKQVLTNKLSHIINITRAVVESTNQRTMLICSAEIADLISIQWQLSKGKLNYNYQDGNYYLNLSHKLQGAEEQSFMEFIEKLVILDLITQPIITRYFVKFRSFPFMCEHTIGGKENIGKIFAVWMHFYNTYYAVLTEKQLDTNEMAAQKQEYMKQFDNPTDFT